MSGIDLSAAVEAAGRARFEGQFPHAQAGWDSMPPINRHAWREVALPLIAAAAPLIEDAVRTQIAAEIEAKGQRRALGATASDGWINAISVAARIARGDS